MSNPIELINLFWTSAGVFPGMGEISRFDFRDRVEASARAGFKGIGIWHTDLEHTTLHRSLKEMKLILDDNGMKYLELEFLTDWFLDGARKADSDSRKRRLLEAAAALNATHIKVGDFYNTPCPLQKLIDSFAALCAEARQAGTRVGFELMASSRLNNLPEALAMVKAAGATNGGIILDIVHIVNLGIPFAEISRIPLQHLLNFELNDGTLPGSPNEDPTRARRFCGEGEYDIRGLIRCAREMGYAGPWAVEVMSQELAPLPLEEVTSRAYRTTLAQFDLE